MLAGLKPEVILDISGRAIAFYEYQLSQELCFKSILQSNIEQKYNTLKEQFNMMNRDLNHIIKGEGEEWLEYLILYIFSFFLKLRKRNRQVQEKQSSSQSMYSKAVSCSFIKGKGIRKEKVSTNSFTIRRKDKAISEITSNDLFFSILLDKPYNLY